MPPILPILFGGALTLAAAAALGALVLGRAKAAFEVRLAVGAVLLSTAVFGLLAAGVLSREIVLGLGAGAIGLAAWRRGATADPMPTPGRSAAVLFSAYGAFYLVNALAPETAADGITYHLGLVAGYVRTGGFPDRVAFYEMLPQGMEMLYTAAFSIGRHSAAKLVEFGLFAASFPLFYRIGGRLGLSRLAVTVAATFYFFAPVVGITGSSSYNDAGQVFFALAAFYLLLLWHESSDVRLLLPAGLLAGFCYAVKMPGLIVPAVAMVILLAGRKWKAAALFGAGAALAIAPWMIRALALTGNPFAPLFNQLFPNPYFHIATEAGLARDLRSLHGIPWWRVGWELALGGAFTGIYGPLLLAAPAALLSLRDRAGRLCLVLAVALALPWLTNSGARFLMLAIPLLALALGMAAARLGRAVALVATVLQAVMCLPPVIARYETLYGFRLHEFPLAAALRIESEDEYLAGRLDEYKVARMLRRDTPPDARILALLPVATAYVDREVVVTWQSAEADRLLDTLRVAGLYGGYPLYDVHAEWPLRALDAVRVRLPDANPNEWCIHEFDIYSGNARVAPGRDWTLGAWPDPWEAPFGFDRNLATRWRTWEPMKAGMYFEVEVRPAQQLSAASLISHTPIFGTRMEFFGRTPEGAWLALSSSPSVAERPREDLRQAAIHAVRRAGYGFLLVPEVSEGNGPIGRVMAGREKEWGLEEAGQAGNVHLFRVP